MLFPVYVVGFIVSGLVFFAIAQRIPNPRAKRWLRAIGILAGPVFFLVVFSFSGWKHEKTYEMTWLVGRPAAEYLSYAKSATSNYEDLVVLKRDLGNGHECYDILDSSKLAQYLESLQARTVKVRYMVSYDFYEARGSNIESIGDFGHDPASQREIFPLGGGEKAHSNAREYCFTW